MNKNQAVLDRILSLAILKKDLEMVKYAIENGADENMEQRNRYLLYCNQAPGEESESIIKYLVDTGANPNYRDEDGRTSLFYASCVDLLRNLGADLYVKDNHGFNALDYNFAYGNVDRAEQLYSAGLRLTPEIVKNKYGKSSSIFYGARSFKIYHHAVACGAKADHANNIMFGAIESKNIELLKFLRLHGEDFSTAISPSGKTPLMEALPYDESDYDFNLFKELVDLGADINRVTKNRAPALMQAYENGYLDAYNYMIEKGADVNISYSKPSSSGSRYPTTILIDAIERNYLDLAENLMGHGADPFVLMDLSFGRYNYIQNKNV